GAGTLIVANANPARQLLPEPTPSIPPAATTHPTSRGQAVNGQRPLHHPGWRLSYTISTYSDFRRPHQRPRLSVPATAPVTHTRPLSR
ncbi:hypothetical protein BaRGS_00017942, partial [Batillaria attramentaria]